MCGEKRRETADDFDVLPRRILRLSLVSLSSLNITAWMGPPLKSVFSPSRLMFTTHVQVMRRIKREHQINGRNEEPHKWNDAGNPPRHVIMCGAFAEQMQFQCDIGLSAVKAELVWSICTITL